MKSSFPFRSTSPKPISSVSSPVLLSFLNWQTGLIFLVLLASSLGFAVYKNWLPSPIRLISSTQGGGPLFEGRIGVSQSDARKLYKDALKSLQAGSYSQAIQQFQVLEGIYPGLNELILLHEAEAYAKLAQERPCQQSLQAILDQFPGTPLTAMVKYQLGQSYYRGQQEDQAKAQFEQLSANHAQTPYAIGSLYYLGALALKHQQTFQAQQDWLNYLQQSPDGRFAVDIAHQLEKLLSHPTAIEHQALGLAYASTGQDWSLALKHLTKAPLQQVWFQLGKAWLATGQRAKGLQVLQQGIYWSKDADQLKDAVDLILRKTTVEQGLAFFQQVNPKRFAQGGDYILWQLAQLKPVQAQAIYQKILSEFSQGSYAPESSWALLKTSLNKGDSGAFLQKAEVHLQQYPHSRSAPRVLFWQAKVFEKQGKREIAIQKYQQLRTSFPHNYYAFRAWGKLKALQEGKPDPGWQTIHLVENYPPDFSSPKSIHLPDAQILGARISAVSQELVLIGAADDLATLLKEQLGEVPPSIDSWRFFEQGDRAKAIRTIRDAVEADDKKGILPNADDLKLMYPICFSQEIKREAANSSLNPYLVQSLMREESYFNEVAISSSSARGLMQLMPATAAEVAKQVGLPHFQTLELFVPAVNIRLGSHYLGQIHRRFSENSMLAVGSYNAGPNAVKRWTTASNLYQTDPDLFIENIPYGQTRDYIKKIYTSFWNYNRLYSPQTLANSQ